jgi:hypothetical protein
LAAAFLDKQTHQPKISKLKFGGLLANSRDTSDASCGVHRSNSALFYHFVGAGEERWGKLDTNRRCSLCVQDQLK